MVYSQKRCRARARMCVRRTKSDALFADVDDYSIIVLLSCVALMGAFAAVSETNVFVNLLIFYNNNNNNCRPFAVLDVRAAARSAGGFDNETCRT